MPAPLCWRAHLRHIIVFGDGLSSLLRRRRSVGCLLLRGRGEREFELGPNSIRLRREIEAFFRSTR